MTVDETNRSAVRQGYLLPVGMWICVRTTLDLENLSKSRSLSFIEDWVPSGKSPFASHSGSRSKNYSGTSNFYGKRSRSCSRSSRNQDLEGRLIEQMAQQIQQEEDRRILDILMSMTSGPENE